MTTPSKDANRDGGDINKIIAPAGAEVTADTARPRRSNCDTVAEYAGGDGS